MFLSKLRQKVLTVIVLSASPLFAFDIQSYFKGVWGVGGSVLQTNYVNEKTSNTLYPNIFGSIGSLQIEGNRLLYPLYTTANYHLLATANFRSHQYSEVYEKEKSIEGGLTLQVPLSYGFTSRMAVLGDISNIHNGYELEAQLFRHDRIGKLSILTAVALQHQNKDLANYYYGTDDYTTPSGNVFEVELIATYPMGNFALFAGVKSYWFETNISNSPLASSSHVTSSFFGVGYKF